MNLRCGYGTENTRAHTKDIVMPLRCTHGRRHDHPARLKSDFMTYDKRQVRRFSKTVIKYNR